MVQIVTDVRGHSINAGIAPGAVLLQCFERDPVQVSPELALRASDIRLTPPGRLGRVFYRRSTEPRAQGLGILFADDLTDVIDSACPEDLWIERQHARQQFIEYDAQRVHIAARVDILIAQVRLFRTHILRGADHLALLGIQGSLGQRLADGSRDAKVDDLGDYLLILDYH